MSAAPLVGVLGGGQLGRMLAMAGIPLGVRFRFLDPDPESPSRDVGELIVGAYDDPRALERFARGLTVATYEFENVPALTAAWLTEHVPVYPSQRALAVSQDRMPEKQLFRSLGIEVPAFAPVDSLDDLHAACAPGGPVGLPGVLKTRRFGYDGKGQAVLRSARELDAALAALTGGAGGGRVGGCIVERLVPFERELSLVAVRGRAGAGGGGEHEIACYPLVENVHRAGILRRTTAPAPNVSAELQARAELGVRAVLEALDYVGVLAIEFFEVGGGLLANEMAPRVHNSGHWTMDGAETSQFENHVRAILGWTLGATGARHGATVMVNLIGSVPNVNELLACPGAHTHLYGKAARPGRKVGHVNVTGGNHAEALRRASAVEALARVS